MGKTRDVCKKIRDTKGTFHAKTRSSPKLTSIESVMPSNHLILCCPLLLPSIFPIRKGGIVRSPQHHRRERTSHGGGAVRVSTASLDGGPHVGPPGGLHTITGERGLHTGDHEGPLEMRPSSIAPNPVESREGPPNSRAQNKWKAELGPRPQTQASTPRSLRWSNVTHVGALVLG